MICNLCKDTGTIEENQGHSLCYLPCPKCTPPIKSCDKSHTLISFRGFVCPLCEALEKLEMLDVYKAELRRWRSLSRTTNQEKESEAANAIRTRTEKEANSDLTST